MSFVKDAGATIGHVLIALQSSYPGLYELIKGVCFISSIFFLIGAILSLSRLSTGKGHGIGDTAGSVMWKFFTSVILAFMPEMMNTVSLTVTCLKLDTPNIFAYTGPVNNLNSGTDAYVTAVIQFVKFCGLLFFVNGVFAMRRVATGNPYNGETWRSVKWRLIGGVMAFNITTTLGVLFDTIAITPPAFLADQLQSASCSI